MDSLIPRVVSPNDVHSWDRDLANRIQKFAEARKWSTYKSPRWNHDAAAVLRRRLGRVGITPEKILAVWLWYEQNFDILYRLLPRVGSAKRFGALWDWITREMDKQLPPPPPPGGLSKDTQWVLRELDALYWPAGSDKQLPAVVAQSLDNLGSFVARLKQSDLPRELAGYRDQVLAVVGNAADYILDWFRAVHRRYANWADWNGDLGRHVWTPISADFVNQMITCLRRYCGSDKAWPRLAEHLK